MQHNAFEQVVGQNVAKIMLRDTEGNVLDVSVAEILRKFGLEVTCSYNNPPSNLVTRESFVSKGVEIETIEIV